MMDSCLEFLLDQLKSLSPTGIAVDSRRVKPGDVFFACPGVADDGCRYVNEAVKAGALAVVAPFALELPLECSCFVFPDVIGALHAYSRIFYNNPLSRLKVVAVTGTNGKTSITYLLEAILTEAGHAVGVVGTVNYRFKGQVWAQGGCTTPGALDLYELASQMCEQGGDVLLLEASSHALKQRRLLPRDVDVALFTNLTRDHLDYHGSMEDYLASKRKLFEELPEQSVAVVNSDDPYALRMLDNVVAKCAYYGWGHAVGRFGIEQEGDFGCRVSTKAGVIASFRHCLWGKHNFYNVLAACSVAYELGVPEEAIRKGLSQLQNIPGRLEEVRTALPFRIFIDYAHTPDGLVQVLSALKPDRGKLLVVFGCGGNRDCGKRPLMAAAVEQYADWAIVTSDNPRLEDPCQIINDILAGFQRECYSVEMDREQAIKRALRMAQPDDFVLIAGKGHEGYQELSGGRISFSDAEIVRQFVPID